MLQACWINIYLGPPDVIIYNISKNFISKEFKQYIVNIGIITKSVPVEAYNLIGMVKRYHGPLQCIYHIITFKVPGIDKDIALQMAFKAINDFTRLDGLIPILLVFRMYPQMTKSDTLSLIVI